MLQKFVFSCVVLLSFGSFQNVLLRSICKPTIFTTLTTSNSTHETTTETNEMTTTVQHSLRNSFELIRQRLLHKSITEKLNAISFSDNPARSVDAAVITEPLHFFTIAKVYVPASSASSVTSSKEDFEEPTTEVREEEVPITLVQQVEQQEPQQPSKPIRTPPTPSSVKMSSPSSTEIRSVCVQNSTI